MEIDTMDMVFAIEIVCLIMFIWHRYVQPIKWITEIDLGILRIILPVLFIGGMIWGIVDRKPYDYGLSWEEKDRLRSIALQNAIKENNPKKSIPPHEQYPLKEPDTEFSIPIEKFLGGAKGTLL